MKHLKKFNESHHIDRSGKFQSRLNDDVIELVAVITNDGKVLNKSGFVEDMSGIFDSDENQYPAGIDKEGCYLWDKSWSG